MTDPGVDTTYAAAFAVGFVSFVSPCVLPLVPGYLAAVSGQPLVQSEAPRRGRFGVLVPALIFCLSFALVFVALGMTATGLGAFLQQSRGTLDKVAGGLMVAMGTLFVITPFVPKLNREWRSDALMSRVGTGGPLIAGAAFAFAWTPCVGPTLGAILAAAGTTGSAGQGGALLAVYSAGMAVPFLLTAVGFTRATSAFRWLRDHYTVITAFAGAVLVAMGLLIYTGEMFRLNIEAQQLLSDLGLDFLYSL
jgi:cytochrome c-type biogenesis protein